MPGGLVCAPHRWFLGSAALTHLLGYCHPLWWLIWFSSIWRTILSHRVQIYFPLAFMQRVTTLNSFQEEFHLHDCHWEHRFYLIAWKCHIITWMQYCGFIWIELHIWYDMRYISIWAGIWMYRALQDYFRTANCLYSLFNASEKRTDEDQWPGIKTNGLQR